MRADDPHAETAVDLAYEVSGVCGAPVLLLVHGGTSSRRAWDLVTPALREHHRIVAVDLRGHGQSPSPVHGYSPAQLGADLARVVDRLALQDVTLVGHSLGGMAAIAFAACRPDVVKAVVLLDVAITPKTIAAIADVASQVRRADFFPVTQAFADRWSPPSDVVPAAYQAMQREHLLTLRPHVWQQVFDELVEADLTSTLADVVQPTLILWGARDVLVDAAQRELLRTGIPHARLVVIEGAGHTPSKDAPDRVAAEIATFVESDA